MSAAWLFLWLTRLPCLPVELGELDRQAPPPIVEAPPAGLTPPPPQPPPAPPPPPAPLPLPPPLAMREEARYRITYGLLGGVGEVRLSIDGERAEGQGRLVKAGAFAEGAILGLGAMQKRIDVDFDPTAQGSRRWTTVRVRGGKTTTDVIDQPRSGALQLVRQQQGKPTESHQVSFLLSTFDAMGLLLRLRTSPPAPGQTVVLQLLDGLALWRITLTARGPEVLPDSNGGGARGISSLRFDGVAQPIFYDGSPDPGDRPRRTFSLWLSDDQPRIPLRLSVPVGISDVIVQLVDLSRYPRAPAR